MELRAATMADSNMLFIWRNEPSTRAVSRHTEEISREDHDAWMRTHVDRGFPWHQVLIAKSEQRNYGVVRFDADTKDTKNMAFEVSITVSPFNRGLGFGQQILTKACKKFSGFPLLAEIKDDNIASRKLFERCGFKEIGSDQDFIQYRREPQ